MLGGRNWYTVMFQSGTEYGWVVIYAYGRDHHQAMAEGFHLSDIQPHPEDILDHTSWDVARDLANRLNDEARLEESDAYLNHLLTTDTPREGE